MTTVAVTFGDVEAMLTGVLPGMLATRGHAGTTVATRVPSPRPARFVRVIASSGNRRNLVAAAPSVTIEGWAESESAAWALTESARACVELLAGQVVGGVTVIRSRDFPPPANFPDPESAQFRYTTTGAFVVRGHAFT